MEVTALKWENQIHITHCLQTPISQGMFTRASSESMSSFNL